MRENDLYKPINIFFKEKLADNLGVDIYIEETHRTISDKIKEQFPMIQEVANVYSYKPDLIGIVNIKGKASLIIIEVKDDPLKLPDLYQAKRYSEIIGADYSFLLSPFNFTKEDHQLLATDDMGHLKNYYLKSKNKIIRNKIITGILNLDEENMVINSIDFDTNFIFYDPKTK